MKVRITGEFYYCMLLPDNDLFIVIFLAFGVL